MTKGHRLLRGCIAASTRGFASSSLAASAVLRVPCRNFFSASTQAIRTSPSSLSRLVSSPFSRQQRRFMFIQTELTPNENSLKFRPGVPVLSASKLAQQSSVEFSSLKEATRSSPLARQLFLIDGVESVMFGPDFVTVSKHADHAWQLMKPDIFAALSDFFAGGEREVLTDSFAQTAAASDVQILDTDSETVQMIKELIDTRVRPTIQSDGGDLVYLGFNEETGIVRLKLTGSCRTCSSSVVTLKNGIETMLSFYIPAVKGVERVTDDDGVSDKAFNELEKKLEVAEQHSSSPSSSTNAI